MRVVVTGANGFIGQHLCAAFSARGDVVVPVIRADFARGRFEELIRGADILIHGAGATRAPTRAQLRTANVELTRRALAAAKNGDVTRFVFISSQAAGGPAPMFDKPVHEDDPPQPIDAYGESKRDAELLVRESGIAASIVRPSAVYGPHDRDFRAMFSLARRGLAIHAGNRNQWISIIHAADCAAAIVRVATSEAAIGRTYFLANDEPVQWDALFALARQAAGARDIVDVEIPLPLVKVGALGGDVLARITGKASLLTSEKVALSAPKFWLCSNERAKRELDFAPRIALRDGVAATYRWYLDNGGL